MSRKERRQGKKMAARIIMSKLGKLSPSHINRLLASAVEVKEESKEENKVEVNNQEKL